MAITWGARIVIPPQGRKSLLDELHVGHPGMSRMKALARGLLWWPLLDRDIEDAVKQCIGCCGATPHRMNTLTLSLLLFLLFLSYVCLYFLSHYYPMGLHAPRFCDTCTCA